MSVTVPQSIIAAAQAADQATAIPASVTIAQWALESGWGARCTGTFNYFGIKAIDGQSCTVVPTHEVVGGQRVLINARFANYESMSDAFTAHAKLLADQPQYEAARACLPDALAFLDKMAPVYATDPNYANVLTQIIQDHNLLQYDAKASPPPSVGP